MRSLEVAGIDMVHAGVDLSGRCLMQAYAPKLNKRCRPYLKPTNKSYRIDETYIKYKGKRSPSSRFTPMQVSQQRD